MVFNLDNRSVLSRLFPVSIAFIAFMILLVSSVFAQDNTVADNERQAGGVPVAVGDDGIVVTMKDVGDVIGFFKKGVYRLTPDAYNKYAVMLRLFSEEAEYLGIEDSASEDSAGKPFEKMKRLADKYTAKLLRDYKIDDLVIESYFYAHPNEFEDYNEQTGEYIPLPLDDAAKDSIRQKVVLAKKMRIQDDAYEYLKSKYNIRLCYEGEDCF